MELGMHTEASVIAQIIRRRVGMPAEQIAELLAVWASERPEEATADRLSILMRDMGFVSTAVSVRRLCINFDDEPGPWIERDPTGRRAPTQAAPNPSSEPARAVGAGAVFNGPQV